MNNRLLVNDMFLRLDMIRSVNLYRLVMRYMLAIIRSGSMMTFVLGLVIWHSLWSISWDVFDWRL